MPLTGNVFYPRCPCVHWKACPPTAFPHLLKTHGGVTLQGAGRGLGASVQVPVLLWAHSAFAEGTGIGPSPGECPQTDRGQHGSPYPKHFPGTYACHEERDPIAHHLCSPSSPSQMLKLPRASKDPPTTQIGGVSQAGGFLASCQLAATVTSSLLLLDQ